MRLLFTFLLTTFCYFLNAQLSGIVTSSDGEVLPYATIFIEDTSTGTTTNLDGQYVLPLTQGEYSIRVQYIGYESKLVVIQYDGTPQTKNITLISEAITVPEIVITADAEDPAYEIIRKARKRRDLYKNSTKSYEADLYIKGLVKMLDAPDKFLGQEIGSMDGVLDSTRQGIVYLSESKSKIYFDAPDDIKEVMYASKVAGDDNGISFNQFFGAKFSFYEEFIDFGRNLISPLADASFRHYKFKLIGTILDDDGHMINKIQVIPKRNEGPVFFGTIYIAEDFWYLHQVDLGFTGKAAREAVFDTITIKQLYNTKPLQDQQVLQQQIVGFSMGLFAFKMGGTFSYFLSQYNIDPQWTESPFSAELFKMEEGANELKTTYWDTIRPIPLTLEESKDYIKKDSLSVLWKSQTFLDSTDRVSNKFKLLNVLFGYQYSQSYKHRYYGVSAPLSTYQFNPVEGHVFALKGHVRLYNDKENKYWKIEPTIRYGFADKQLKPSLSITRKYDSRNIGSWSLAGGRQYSQFDGYNPVGTFGNTLGGLFLKQNNLKLYDENFVKASWSQEVVNGIFGAVNAEYVQRSTLINNSDYSFNSKEEPYNSNRILLNASNGSSFDLAHKGLIVSTKIRWRPGQRYLSIGSYKNRIRSNWPDFTLFYKKAIPIDDSFVDYDFIELAIVDRKVDMNLFGYSSFRATVGGFINKERVGLPDSKHYHGNLVPLIGQKDYLAQFKVLPYYDYSHNETYGELFIEHHFDGHLMDRIPLLKKLGVKSVFGLSSFYQDSDKNYVEASIGIDDIGISIFKAIRLDYAIGFYDGKKINSGFVLMLKQSL